jgi:hypothetical protein
VTSTYRDPVLEKQYRWLHAVLLLVGSRLSDSVARFATTDVYKSVQIYITKHSRTALANSKAHARTVCTDVHVEDTKNKQANQAHVRKTGKKKWIQHRAVPGWSPTPVLSGLNTF